MHAGIENSKKLITKRMDTQMNSREIRQEFLEYFRKHGHEVVESSSLIPKDDPTLLFTNAGNMIVQIVLRRFPAGFLD